MSQLEITKRFCNAEEDSSEDDNEQDQLSDAEDCCMDETNEDPVFPIYLGHGTVLRKCKKMKVIWFVNY